VLSQHYKKTNIPLPAYLLAALLVLAAYYLLRTFFPQAESQRYFVVEAPILAGILIYLRMPAWLIAMVVVSSFLQCTLLFRTTIITSGVDIEGHLDYIYYLLDHDFIPPAPLNNDALDYQSIQNQWHRQQPPLYYAWCALAAKLGDIIGVEPTFMIRMASRILYLGYVIFTLLLIRCFRFPALIEAIAVAMILFWPFGQQVSVRTNNDIGFMLFFMASLYGLQRWDQTHERKYFSMAAICAGLSFLCKASGAISLTIVGLMSLYALVFRDLPLKYFFNRAFLWPGIAAVTCVALYFGRLAYYIFIQGQDILWFANVQPGHEVVTLDNTPATLSYFLQFNVREFITDPGGAPFWEYADRYHYGHWDILFRTLLFEDIAYRVKLFQKISILWIGVWGMCLWQVLRCCKRDQLRNYAVPVITLLAMIAIHMTQRAQIANHYMSNGRYIYPITAMVAILVAGLIHNYFQRKQLRIYLPCYAVAATFAFASLALSASNALGPR
jgi:hypothetical protein